MSTTSRTLLLCKPDAVERALIGRILDRFEDAFTVTALELQYPDQSHIESHYAEHREKPFFGPLVEYLTDSPVVAAVLSGERAVSRTREMVGHTDPAVAEGGTIRGDFGTDSMDAADAEGRALRNLVHASANPEDATRELSLWFPDHEGRPQ